VRFQINSESSAKRTLLLSVRFQMNSESSAKRTLLLLSVIPNSAGLDLGLNRNRPQVNLYLFKSRGLRYTKAAQFLLLLQQAAAVTIGCCCNNRLLLLQQAAAVTTGFLLLLQQAAAVTTGCNNRLQILSLPKSCWLCHHYQRSLFFSFICVETQ